MSWLQRLAFDVWYLGRPPWDTGISPPELLEFISDHPAGRAIDLGCGTGTNVVTLARAGWQVTGVDFVGRAVRTARRKARASGVSVDLHRGDVTRLDGVHGPFDLALDIGCFHAVTRRAAYLDQLTGLLAPDGNWLMYAFIDRGSQPAASGLGARDLDLIAARGLVPVWRRDGEDRHARPSAWFLYKRADRAGAAA